MGTRIGAGTKAFKNIESVALNYTLKAEENYCHTQFKNLQAREYFPKSSKLYPKNMFNFLIMKKSCISKEKYFLLLENKLQN